MPGTSSRLSSATALLLLATASLASAADLDRGQKIFRACASCHSLAPDGKGFGPTLHGIVGRPAAQVQNFNYSPAMQAAGAAGLIWDDKALAEFLTRPQAKVPGTSMRFWGLWSSELDDLMAYLKKASANP